MRKAHRNPVSGFKISTIASILILTTACSASPTSEHRAAEVAPGPELLLLARSDGDLDIYLASPGVEPRKLTHNDTDDLHARWSPDGDHIAFVSRNGEGFQLFVLDVGTGNLRQITEGKTQASSPWWAPTGDQIAFVTGQPDGTTGIYIADLHDNAVTRLTTNSVEAGFPQWSPAGEWIAYLSAPPNQAHTLNVIRSDGTAVRRLLAPDAPAVIDYAWAPDGQSLVMTGRQNRIMNQYRIDIASATLEQLTDQVYVDSQGSIDHTGQQLLFASSRDLRDRPQIYRLNMQNREAQRLSFSDRAEAEPAWAPGSCHVAFTRFVDRAYRVFLLDLRSDREIELAPSLSGPHLQPQFRPRPDAPRCGQND